MRRLLPLFCLTLLACSVCRAQDCQRLRDALWPQGVVHARFEVIKEVPGLPVPLVSRGVVTLDPARGVIWETLEPFADLQIFGPQKSARTDASGNLVVSENARASRLVKELSVDRAQSEQRLRERFHLSCSVKGERTRALLSPRDNLLQNYLTEAALVIGRAWEEVTLYTPEAKRTRIVFSDQRLDSAPSAADLRHFEAVQ